VINSAVFANPFAQNPVSVTVNATDDRSIAEVDLAAFGQKLQLNLSADGLYHGTVPAPRRQVPTPRKSLSGTLRLT